jgi:hypothetical protein
MDDNLQNKAEKFSDLFNSYIGAIGVNEGRKMFVPKGKMCITSIRYCPETNTIYAHLEVDGHVIISASLDYIKQKIKTELK